MFAWLNKLANQRADRKFSEELPDPLPLLFIEHAAETIPNERDDHWGRRSFDYAIAAVTTPELLLRFIRVRGQIDVYVSPPNGPRKWDELDLPLGCQDWSSIDSYLSGNWKALTVPTPPEP